MKSSAQKQACPMLQYEFSDPGLLEEALRHSSFVNEQIDPCLRNNERLEFLGDAVLNLIVGHILMIRFPDTREGELSRMRAGLVNEFRLAAIARTLELGACIQLGKGEAQTHGRDKNSILADALEAVIAAVYLDGGFDAAYALIQAHFTPLLDTIHTPAANRDYKSQLQERVQERREFIPVYQIVRETGPDHDKTFEVAVTLNSLVIEGSGKSKKLAEQDAARKALTSLNQTDENKETGQ